LASGSDIYTKFTEALKEEAAIAGKETHSLCILGSAHGDFNEDFGFDLCSCCHNVDMAGLQLKPLSNSDLKQ